MPISSTKNASSSLIQYVYEELTLNGKRKPLKLRRSLYAAMLLIFNWTVSFIKKTT